MKVAYIAHPFGGKPENVQDVERIIRQLIKQYPKYTFYSPLHNTGFFYNDIDYDTGLEHCLAMLKRCDELWLCKGWANSRGCMREVVFAHKHSIPIYQLFKEGNKWILKKY